MSYQELALAKLLLGATVVTDSFPVLFASGATLGLAAIILLGLCLLVEGRLPRLDRREALLLAIQSFAGIFLFRIFVLTGLKMTTATAGGIIFSTTPALIGLLSFLVLRERLYARRVIAILLALAGVLIINVSQAGRGGGGKNPVLGNMIVFLAVAGDALFTILRRLTDRRISPLAASALVSLIASILFLPFTVWEAISADFSALPWSAWLILLFQGTLGPVAAFLLWFTGLKRVEAGTAAVFTGLVPLGSMILSLLFLGESIPPAALVGTCVILLGIAVTAARKGRLGGAREAGLKNAPKDAPGSRQNP